MAMSDLDKDLDETEEGFRINKKSNWERNQIEKKSNWGMCQIEIKFRLKKKSDWKKNHTEKKTNLKKGSD